MREDEFRSLSEEEKQAYISHVLKTSAPEERKPFITTGFPNRMGVFFAALLGLPVEHQKSIRHPFMITFFIGIMFLVHLYSTSKGLKDVVMERGFIPTYWYRDGLLSLISSFFLHGSWMHLLSNSYYFYVFGDDVEDDMDLISFVGLLFGGHLLGIILHSFLGGASDIPMVGASAGISALLGYYMVRFPKRQISYMVFFFYVWIHVPAILAFIWKFLWEFMIVTSPAAGFTGVAHWGHLGGALFGALFALRIVNKEKKELFIE